MELLPLLLATLLEVSDASTLVLSAYDEVLQVTRYTLDLTSPVARPCRRSWTTTKRCELCGSGMLVVCLHCDALSSRKLHTRLCISE